MWQTLRATSVNLGRARRARDDQEAIESMSSWELELVPAWKQESLEPAVVQAAINAMQECLDKKQDIALPFMERVPDTVAKDYRQHITGEMWLSLIHTRLLNGYYRHLEHLYFELELIPWNSRLYNGEQHPLTLDAKRLIEAVKRNIRGALNTHIEDLEMAPVNGRAGKLSVVRA